VVECDLAKVEVAGSNPVSRSRFLLPALDSSNTNDTKLHKEDPRYPRWNLGHRGKSSNINKCPIVLVSIMRRVLIPHEVFKSAL
jgi:hypothetical protein